MDKLKNKKYLLTSVFILLLITISISYAYWQFNKVQKDLNVAGTNCFSLTYTDNTDSLVLDNIVPTEDEEGLKEKGYSFTIKNTCNTIATYEVNLEDILASSNIKHMPNKYIKVSLNNSTPKVLNTYEEVKTTISNATNSFKLTSGSLKPDEEATYELKLWMDSETPAIDEVMSATFESKITVNTSYIEEENLVNDITIAATSQNEDYSKEKEAFTIDITSTNKNIIEYSFNNQTWTSVIPTKTLTIEKEYTKEGSYPIYVKDEVGNIKEYLIVTEKLDQTSPERNIESINNHETYLLKITMEDAKSGMDSYQITESQETPSEWISYTGMIEKEIDKNGTYYIWSKDKTGNISYEAYSIEKIDKESPKITLSNDLTSWGITDTIHIHLTDDFIGLSGYQVTTSEEEPINFITIENTLETTIDYEVIENGTYYVYAKDAYNHISHEKIIIDKVDNKAPVINSITNSSNGEWTNQNVSIVIDGQDNETSISKYQIKYSKTNNLWTDLTNNTNLFTEDLNETVYYRIIDKAGNISEEKSVDIKIDKTAPNKPSISNSKENTWTGSDLPITLTSDDEGSGIDYFEWYENGTWTTRALATSQNVGTITYTVTGNETIRFRVIDKVGNISEESTTVVKLDKTKPSQSFSVASSTSGSNGWYKALSITTTLSDSQSGVSSSKYCITTGSSCTPSTAATLSNNTFTIALGTNASAQKVCVNTTDKVGNVSSTSCSSTYSVDTTAPTAKISVSKNGNSITVNASESSDSGSGIATYYYSKDGGNSFISSSSNSYTFTGLSDGNYNLALKVSDIAGLTSTTVTSSQTVKYTWVVSYNANGGSGAPGNQTKYGGSNLTLSSTKPTRTGYTFLGWNTSSSATTSSYAPGAIYNTNANLTLYAVWQVNKYYLDVNGYLDGSSKGNTTGYGTFDVYINGTQVVNDVSDFYQQIAYGSTYEIKDIKSSTGKTYAGVYQGSLTGTIGAETKAVSLKFNTSALYLFNNGTVYGTTTTWKGKSDAVDYISFGNTIHYDDNSKSKYGNSMIGFNSEIDLTHYKTITVNFKVNSISGATSKYPFIVAIFTMSPSDYQTNLNADTGSNSATNLSKKSSFKDFTSTGTYTCTADISSLTGNYKFIFWVMSHQYASGLINLDITSIVLTP